MTLCFYNYLRNRYHLDLSTSENDILVMSVMCVVFLLYDDNHIEIDDEEIWMKSCESQEIYRKWVTWVISHVCEITSQTELMVRSIVKNCKDGKKSKLFTIL